MRRIDFASVDDQAMPSSLFLDKENPDIFFDATSERHQTFAGQTNHELLEAPWSCEVVGPSMA